MEFIKGGLLPLKHDTTKDFKVGAILNLPKLSELPDKFELEGVEIGNQLGSDYCSQFALCGASMLQEGVQLSPEWAFAVSKEMSGDADAFGQDIHTAIRVHTKVGVIEKKEAPYSLENKPDSFLRNIKNWPDLKHKAEIHKKKTYISISGQYDSFDNARATLWKFRDEKRAIAFGVIFSWNLKEKILKGYLNEGYGHALLCVGWEKIDGQTYLKVANSYGKEAGEQGFHYMSRETFNHFINQYGAYMLVDIPRKEIEETIKRGVKLDDPILKRLWATIITLIFSPFMTSKEKIQTLETIKNILENPKEKLKSLCLSYLGKDISEKEDELGCAESVSKILAGMFPFEKILSTNTLYHTLKKDKHFEQIVNIEPWTIIISPTGLGNGAIPYGHAGILGDNEKIYSNNSKTSMWEQNYTLKEWIDRYRLKGGYPLFFFKVVNK